MTDWSTLRTRRTNQRHEILGKRRCGHLRAGDYRFERLARSIGVLKGFLPPTQFCVGLAQRGARRRQQRLGRGLDEHSGRREV
jgi:hypothetical protein